MLAGAKTHRLSYITDLELTISGGGSFAVNWHAVDQLNKRFAVSYAGLLMPKPRWLETAVSRIRRKVLRRPGRFTYFSPRMLDRNANMAAQHMGDVDVIMFRSATRWCRCRPVVPYFVYLDVVFHTFFHNTFSPADFMASDLERIWREEAAFLEGAAGVFFESRWGLEKAVAAYGLRGTHYTAPGRGGVINPPATDTWSCNTRKLVSIALDFQQKGGDITLGAYRLLKARFPSLTWHIIGGPPAGDWKSVPGITYEGVLRPDIPAELARLRAVLSDAFLMVHPTREDTSPLVLTEAAYFGCPSVSVNSFAIPELVENGVSGILVQPPPTTDAIADAIASLLANEKKYLAMRVSARSLAIDKHSWDRIGSVICTHIENTL